MTINSTIRTQDDLARLAGVTRLTVHRALNNQPGVGEVTRKRIQDLVQLTGYKVNTAAKATATGRFGSIALLQSIYQHRSFLPHDLLTAIHDRLAKYDLHLSLAMVPDEKISEGQYVPKMLRESGCDGMLINYNAQIPAPLLELVKAHSVPAVWINAKMESDCVFPDDMQAGMDATEHLLALGHRRIAYLHFGAVQHYSAIDRRDGYCAAMQKAGLDVCLYGGPAGSHVPAKDRPGMVREFLERKNAPTAIIVYGEDSLLPLLFVAGECGIQVPEDLSIVTFGAGVYERTGQTISTFILPECDVGVTGTDMLMEKMKNPSQRLTPKLIQFNLVDGASCAPPSDS